MARSKALLLLTATTSSRSSRNPAWFLPLSVALPALLACPALAAKWDLVPTLSAETTFTDNVALAPSASKASDWVTQLRPGVSLNGGGARLKLNATYSAEFLNGADSGRSDLSHQFSGSGNLELVRQFLFIDARGSVAQQNISLLGPQTDSNVNTTGNRATIRTTVVSPYLRHSFGPAAEAEVRLTHGTVSSDSTAALAKSQGTGISMRITSGPAFRLYTWNVAYSRDSVGSAQQPEVTTERITAGGRRLITSQVALVSSVGYETSDYAAIGKAPSGTFWNAGFEWSPTPRTRLVATTGKRYLGTNRSLNFSHRTRLTTWSANYSEDVTTTHAQTLTPSSVSTASFLDTLFLAGVPDPVARQLAVQNFIAQNGLPASLTVPLNLLTTQTILVKRWQASVGIHGVHNTVLGNVFTQTSEAVAAGVAASGAGDFASSSTVKQMGAGVLWNWRIATRLASNVSAGFNRSEFPSLGRKDDSTYLRLAVTRQFQPKLTGSLNVRSLRNESNVAGAGYTENAISAALNMRF